MAAAPLQMKLSQESLFFLLPFTNATIDNVVEIQNPLPPVKGDPMANVISFKILSEVQHRYSVRPPVGFIAPGDHVTIVFSFNPEQVKAAKNPADRELPTEATRDAIHIDFALVDAASVAAALVHWTPGGKDSKASREVQADASAFWKKRGQVTQNSPTTMRFKLRCVFDTRNNAPGSLVISMKEENGKGAAGQDGKKTAEVNAAVPKTRPPATSTTDPRSTAPPEAPPHRHSETPRESTPRNEPSHTARATAPATTATTVPAAAAAARPAPPSAPAPKPAVKFPASSSGASDTKKKSLVSAVMNYKLSYAVVAVLILLTVLCGLWDHGNILTWMIGK